MACTDDVLIVGRGIAGAMLTEVLRSRGLRVHVFDVPRPGAASRVAAGVVNPVVLRRDVPSWRAAELLPLAARTYTAFGERHGLRVWHPTELVKLFPTPKEAEQWRRAMDDTATAPFIDQRAQPEVEAAPIAAPHGHGTVVRSAWLDVPALLDAQRAELLRDGALTEVEVAQVREEADAVHIHARSAPLMIWCNGAFGDVAGLVPVKGEGLTVRIPGLRLTRMVHRGVFLLPTPALGPEVYRVGATFKWDEVWAGATEEGRRWLLEKVARITDRLVEPLDQWAGVRPAAKDRRPLLGRITARQAVLNGLGSRGVLLAPWCAQHLAVHLFDGLALDPEVDVARG
ncbi:MAG: FAD-binding oxidoreductase [Flavobacteriales bacterium]|nr:FAD-binding oxidoreductase [Flavobacteriales bacterium]